MNFQLENEKLFINIKSKGAELSSMIKKSSDAEMIWNADPNYWWRHSPLLFPIVGRLKNNEYQYGDSKYEMKQHGFARDLEFEVISQTSTEITFLLNSNDLTRKVYPFEFSLFIHYNLRNTSLEISYEVCNRGEENMYFSIGGHPAFNIDLPVEEYSIEFDSAEKKPMRTHLESGLLGRREPILLKNDQILNLNEDQFEIDAIIFEDLASTKLTLIKGEIPLLAMSFDGFPYFGVWRKQNAPFLCLEPWYGIADEKDATGLLIDKKGIAKLMPDERKKLSFKIEVF